MTGEGLLALPYGLPTRPDRAVPLRHGGVSLARCGFRPADRLVAFSSDGVPVLAQSTNFGQLLLKGFAATLLALSKAPITEVTVTDTIAIPPERRCPQLQVLSVGELLAKAIRFTHSDQSVSSLFD